MAINTNNHNTTKKTTYTIALNFIDKEAASVILFPRCNVLLDPSRKDLGKKDNFKTVGALL
jgi:hypothetical protein